MPWNPWRALRSREHILFGLGDLPNAAGGGVYARRHGRTIIMLDRQLTRTERNAALAHELVHDERGGGAWADGMPDSWRPRVAIDEKQVDREVARRLVPLDRLADMCDRLAHLGEGVTPWLVADEFDVPEDVAATALDLLTEHERGAR